MIKLLAFMLALISLPTAQAQTSEQVFIEKIKMANKSLKDAEKTKDYGGACLMFYSALMEPYAKIILASIDRLQT
ncbi:hypothetical protein [Polynucleobacter sp. AP-Kolm-20A-A1]|uniref:hypothetical protein n=1 Tax=Polynucleobacter sp. AP-Kolm-20A-A1 TaxID=2081041 RepID=UPI001BFEA4F9|nr:hypothetical protein [Polynucleobacter sp. AP-Kolm-20A-A1]QWE20407.1 hypothetical protein C2745_08410 [Polynucleobacter sp. AP-Kolm-20A-A1]